MMDGLDLSIINNRKTQEYMSEVVSSFERGNYRSSIVMLYSVSLCDLFFKLQELRDLYSDSYADSLIKRLEEKISKDKSSSSWEKDLVDSLFKDTPILDNESYALIQHLRDYRNLSAHPAMDDYSNLFSPSKEMVEAYIRDIYRAILIKPALFVNSVVDLISEDLSEKKGYILEDEESFKKYIQTKYLARLSEAMKQKVFQAFWKFVFILQDDNCSKNRFINACFLRVLFGSDRTFFMKVMSLEPSRFEIIDDSSIIVHSFVFLSREPEVFNLLPEISQSLIKTVTNANDFYRFLSWFMYDNKGAHIDNLISLGFVYLPPSTKKSSYVERCFKETGDFDHLLRYYVHLVRNATSFVEASSRIERLIIPNLNQMTAERLEDVISSFSENPQVYRNFQLGQYCRFVWEKAVEFFDKEYIQEHYPNFYLPEDIVETIDEEFLAEDDLS